MPIVQPKIHTKVEVVFRHVERITFVLGYEAYAKNIGRFVTDIDGIEWALVPDAVAYIKLTQFNAETGIA